MNPSISKSMRHLQTLRCQMLPLAVAISTAWFSNAIAGSSAWQKIGTSKLGTVFYFDPYTLEEHGKTRVVMILEDRQSAAKIRSETYHSYVSMQVHDCLGRRSAQTSGAFFSGNMAMGKVVYKYIVQASESEFQSVALGTMQEVIHKELCTDSWFDPPDSVRM